MRLRLIIIKLTRLSTVIENYSQLRQEGDSRRKSICEKILECGKAAQSIDKLFTRIFFEPHVRQPGHFGPDPLGDFGAKGLAFFFTAGVEGGVRESPMDLDVGSQPGRALRRGIVAHCNGDIDRVVRELVEVFGFQAVRGHAHSLKCPNGDGLDDPGRASATAEGFELVGGNMPENGFRHLGTARVAGANEENRSFTLGHGIFPSPVG